MYANDVVPDQKQLTVVLGLDLAKNAPTAEPTPADTSGTARRADLPAPSGGLHSQGSSARLGLALD